MNNNIKLAIGTVIGAGIGWFVGEVVVEVIALRELDSAISAVMNPVETHDEETYPVELKETKKMSKNNKTDYAKYFGSDRPDLAALAAKYNGGVVAPEVQESAADDILEELVEYEYSESIEDRIEEEDEDITIISDGEFDNSEGVTKVELFYYDDDILTDSISGTPIKRPEELIGDDALVSFGELSGDEEIVYVRNVTKRALYKVVRMNKDFAAPVIHRKKKAVKQITSEDTDGETTS